MIFEDALKLMRGGKKITHKHLGDDVYFQACYIGIGLLEESSEVKKARGMSIVKMKGDVQHEDMCTGNLDNMLIPGTMILKPLPEKCKHGYYPQLNLLFVMSDDWEIYGEKKIPNL